MSTFNVLIDFSTEGIRPFESVKGSAVALQSIDYIHSSDGLPMTVGGINDGVLDDMFQENLEDPSALLENISGHALYTTPPCHPMPHSLHPWFQFRCLLWGICIDSHTLPQLRTPITANCIGLSTPFWNDLLLSCISHCIVGSIGNTDI